MESKLYIDTSLEAPLSFDFENATVDLFTMKSNTHANNEDSMGIFFHNSKLRVAVVADGMGGHTGGQKASSLILQTFDENLKKYREGQDLRSLILSTIDEAHAGIKDLKCGAGSTLTVLELLDNNARIYHSGDSIVIHLGARGMEKYRTVEHSPLGYGMECGLIDWRKKASQEQVDDHIVANGLGTEQMSVEMSQSLDINNNDLVFLSSDGFHKNLNFEELDNLIVNGNFTDRLPLMKSLIDKDPALFLEDDNSIILVKIKGQETGP